MPHLQYPNTESDTARTSMTRLIRQQPSSQYLPAFIGSPTDSQSAVDPVMQIASNSELDLGSDLSLPDMRHEQCVYMRPPETAAPNYESQRVSQCLSNALRPAHLNSIQLQVFTNPDQSHVLDRPVASFHSMSYPMSPTPQAKNIASDMENSQMHTNFWNSVVPNLSRGQSTIMSQAWDSTPSGQYESSGRDSLTPQLSHIATPESTFSLPQLPQNWNSGLVGVGNSSLLINDHQEGQQMMNGSLFSQLGPQKYVQANLQSPAGEAYFNAWSAGLTCDQDWTGKFKQQNFPRQQNGVYYGDGSLTSLDGTSQGLMVTTPTSAQSSQKHTYRSQPSYLYSLPTTTKCETRPTTGSPDGRPTIRNADNQVRFGNLSSTTGGRGQYPNQSTYMSNAHSLDGSSLQLVSATSPDTLAHDVSSPLPILPSQTLTQPYAKLKPCKGMSEAESHYLDKKLVQWRAEGLTYKEIMKKGNWGLEESSLRGRHRTLTKLKPERLRKPVWNNASLSALVAGVDHLAPPIANNPRTAEDLDKIPWKKVAEWMHLQKSCYLYGNATVKKKYKELIGNQKMQRAVNKWRLANGENPL